MGRGRLVLARAAGVAVTPALAAAEVAASPAGTSAGPFLAGVPVDFLLFALTLAGVAMFHRYALQVALAGLAFIAAWKLGFSPFKEGAGLPGLAAHFRHEAVLLANLFGLLVGFAVLARHFEKTRIPSLLPHHLPRGWPGAFAMLVIVFVLSSFLDNIAAAMIGGTMAYTVFRARVHVGYLAAIVAAANAGGAGSVVGDTTTTMMWIDHVAPSDVVRAYVAAVVALVVCGIPAAMQQHRHSPLHREPAGKIGVDWVRLAIVFAILIAAVAVNVVVNTRFPEHADAAPWLALAVWGAILLTALIRRPDWDVLRDASLGALFLIALVSAASMMPVEQLPPASWPTALALGFVSAVFDNIPLTELALKQGGYDWGFLAFAVGFGGSMLWFGSSAGVALASLFPQARSAGRWLVDGWHVAVAYVVGFFFMLAVLGWHPTPKQVRLQPAIATTAAIRDAAPQDWKRSLSRRANASLTIAAA
jgi:Na+/H+ antiporter NhaD/arsenite permease-like protein